MNRELIINKIARQIKKGENNGRFTPFSTTEAKKFAIRADDALECFERGEHGFEYIEIVKDVIKSLAKHNREYKHAKERVNEFESVYVRHEEYGKTGFEIYSYPQGYNNDIFFKAWDGVNYKIDKEDYNNIKTIFKAQSYTFDSGLSIQDRTQIRKSSCMFKNYIENQLEDGKSISRNYSDFSNDKDMSERILQTKEKPTRNIEHKPYKGFTSSI